jgi:SWI/SNF-related matrix-associated actin-dependent regulator of chromatin subfamily A3
MLIIADFILTAQNSNSGAAETASANRSPTLIICPVSVMSNWVSQVKQHIDADTNVRVYQYHGPDRNRAMDLEWLSSFDIVLTTYQTLGAEYLMPEVCAVCPVCYMSLVAD